jgi:hypothetical protein
VLIVVYQGTDHFLASMERKTRVISEDKESSDEGKPRSLEPQSSTSAQALQAGLYVQVLLTCGPIARERVDKHVSL